MYDVAIVGLGPAGRALAHRCARAGLDVLAIDPDPEAPWSQTLCLWREQLPPWLDADVLSRIVAGPEIRATGRHRLALPYGVVDNAALQAALPLDGVTLRRERAVDADLQGLRSEARRVVDCRGAGEVTPDRPAQTAYGIVVDAAHAVPALDGAEAMLMDWRADHGDTDDIGPTFLYALPLPGGRMLLEETTLAGFPAPTPERLGRRLRSRLLARGMDPAVVDSPLGVEEVRIPLTPPRRSRGEGVEVFGTAAGHGHPATGYSVGPTLGAVAAAVWALETGRPLRRPRDRTASALLHLGLRALLGADARTTTALFDAFGRLPAREQLRYLGGGTPWHRVAWAMWGMAARMPVRSKLGLAKACLTGP